MKKRYLQFLPMALLFGLSVSAAEMVYVTDTDSSVAQEHNWEVRVGIPLWASGAEGTVDVRGNEAAVDADFSDIVDDLDFIAPLNFEARKAGWLIYANGLYVKTTREAEPRGLLRGALGDLELQITQIGGDIGFGYSVVRTPPFRLDIFGGGRLTYLDAELSLRTPTTLRTFERSKFWADPIVGLGGEYRCSDWFALYAKGDVGGFGVSSDLTWQAEGGFDFGLSENIYLRLSYRYLSMDFENGGFGYDMQTGGPQLELGLKF